MSAHATNRMLPPAWVSEDRARVGTLAHVGWIGADVYNGVVNAAAKVVIKAGLYHPGGGDVPAPDPIEDNPNVIMVRDRTAAAMTDAEIAAMCAGNPDGAALCEWPLKQHRAAAIAKIARLGDPNVISDSDRNSAALTDAQIEDMCAPMASLPSGVMTVDNCRLTAQGQRAAAQAKIARIAAAAAADAATAAAAKAAAAAATAKGGKFAGFVRAPNVPNILTDAPVAPQHLRTTAQPPTTASPAADAAAAGAVPLVIGGLFALKFGWPAFAAGGALGVVAAGGVYAWLKLTHPPAVT